MTEFVTAPGRSYSKLSQTPAKGTSEHVRSSHSRRRMNLVDLHYVLHYSDNRAGRRRVPKEFHSWFSRHPNVSQHWDGARTLRASKSEPRIRRRRNASFDLVGIESNPGPDECKMKKKKAAKKKGGNAQKGQMAQKKGPSKPSSQQSKVGGTGGDGLSKVASNYLKSVLVPCSGNARIPDMNTIPTVLLTQTLEGNMVASAGGVIGLVADIKPAAGLNIENPATTTDAAFTYNAVIPFPQAAVMVANFSFVRVVSACVDIQFTGATLSDSGLVVGWSNSALAGGIVGGPTTLTSAYATRVNVANRSKDGISIFYRPGDSSAFNFYASNAVTFYGVLGAHISGAAAAAPYYYKFTVNYECIPASDSISSAIPDSINPSPVDVQGHSKAVSLISQVKPLTTFAKAQEMLQKAQGIAATGYTAYNTLRAFGALF
jgi:hypothetical protein